MKQKNNFLSVLYLLLAFVFTALFLVKCYNVNNTAEIENIDNLIPYTIKSAAWSDQHSDIAITWQNPDSSGLQSLEHIVGAYGVTITNKLLTWELKENNKKLPLKFISRNFRPDKILEISKAEGIEVKVITSFPARNTIALEFIVKNEFNRKRSLDIFFNDPASDSLLNWKGPFPIGNIVSVENEKNGSWATIFSQKAVGINRKWLENYTAGMTDNTPLELWCITDLSKKRITIEPLDSQKMLIPMAFGRYYDVAKERYQDDLRKIKSGWTSNEETKQWKKVFNNAPKLPDKYTDEIEYERLYKHAIAGLQTLFIQGDGGYARDNRILYTTKRGLALSFFWDTGISCVGAREFNSEACQEAISCFIENATPRGSLPGTIADSHKAGEGQAPIMCWAAWSVYQKSKDKKWLEEIYPVLCNYINFWFKYHSSERGLCKYFNAGQIADNDARFDPIMKGEYNQSLYGFESPDLNAFLVMEMKCLSKLAKELNLSEDAEKWHDKAKVLGKKIVDFMYFPDEAMFYDVIEGTHEKYSGVKTPNMFLPLWAGVPLPEREIDKIITQHMLNPNEFYKKYPFPSLSYDNPEYDPTGYWRGRIWPHVVYWMVQTLWKHNYHEEAGIVAQRLLDMIKDSKWIAENYESQNGQAIGQAEYNWSQSTVIELLLERYKDPLPD